MEIDPFVIAWMIGALWALTHPRNPRKRKTRGVIWGRDLTKR